MTTMLAFLDSQASQPFVESFLSWVCRSETVIHRKSKSTKKYTHPVVVGHLNCWTELDKIEIRNARLPPFDLISLLTTTLRQVKQTIQYVGPSIYGTKLTQLAT